MRIGLTGGASSAEKLIAQATRFLSQTWIPALAGLLLLLLATSPPTFGGDGEGEALVVESCETTGSVAEVVVSNSADETRTGTVTVAAKVDGYFLVRRASVSLSGNSASAVRVSFPSQIEGVITVGIRDDGLPF